MASEPPPPSYNNGAYDGGAKYDAGMTTSTQGATPVVHAQPSAAPSMHPYVQADGMPPPPPTTAQQQQQQQAYPVGSVAYVQGQPQPQPQVVYVQGPVPGATNVFVAPATNVSAYTDPAPFTCGSCGFTGLTTTSKTPGAQAWIWCLALFIIFWPLCWVPLVMPSCYDTDHRCPRCGRHIAHHADCC